MPSLSVSVPWVRGRPLGARASPPASRLRGEDALAEHGRPLGAQASPPAFELKPSAIQGKARLCATRTSTVTLSTIGYRLLGRCRPRHAEGGGLTLLHAGVVQSA